MGKVKYFMAAEVTKCSDEVYQTCIFRIRYKDCKSALNSCNIPMKLNPFCTNGDINKCSKLYRIINIKGKDYIFYSCHKSCKYCLNNYEKAIEMYSKLFSNNKLYFGKELDKLVKLIPKSKNPTQSVDNTLEYMEKLFMNMNMRMG